MLLFRFMGKKTGAEKRAKFISIVGHPLLTISLFVVYLTHKELPLAQAKWVSSIILVGVALPVIVRNLILLKKGKYTNFDVSDQKERRNFYPFALMLLVFISIVFYFLHQPKSLMESTLVFTMMVLAFLLCNFVLKASMHAGVNFYITIIMMHYSVV